MQRSIRVLRLRLGLSGLLLVLSSGVSGCHGLLQVTDPTLVQDHDIANAAGANARRLDVVYRFGPAIANMAKDVALMTDERTVDVATSNLNNAISSLSLDRRNSEAFEAANAGRAYEDPHLGTGDQVVTTAAVAIPAVRTYAADSVRGDYLAQLFVMRGYTILQIAEDICPGFPINDIVDNLPVFSAPFTTDSAVQYAITQLDSAIADVHDSTDILNFARITKARALLDLGQYTQAAALVSAVPTTFRRVPGYWPGNFFGQSPVSWNPSFTSIIRMPVGDSEGVNGIPFVHAHDPRVGTIYRAVRFTNSADSLFDQTKYTTVSDTMVVSSGIEARLIEAEAAINAGDPSWFATLNTLRATMITPAMAPIATMPTTKDAQIDLLYRERAFWLYLTGRRLGDMRRLIRNYGRDPESVFPTGDYPLQGGKYGTATAIPFIQAAEARYNPKITSGCTTR